MEIDADNRVIGFEEKPAEPKTDPRRPRHCLASMGIYVFTARFLFEQFCPTPTGRTARTTSATTSSPRSSTRTACSPFRFATRTASKDAYWRDVGTLDAYYEANMDLISVDPQLNMYDDALADPHLPAELPPPKFVFAEQGTTRGAARRSTASSARAPSSPAARSSGRSSGPTSASTAMPTSKTRSSSTASTSAGTPRSAGRSSTRACTFPKARDRLRLGVTAPRFYGDAGWRRGDPAVGQSGRGIRRSRLNAAPL